MLKEKVKIREEGHQMVLDNAIECKCFNCGRVTNQIYRAPDEMRRGFDVYLGTCCYRKGLTIEQAREFYFHETPEQSKVQK